LLDSDQMVTSSIPPLRWLDPGLLGDLPPALDEQKGVRGARAFLGREALPVSLSPVSQRQRAKEDSLPPSSSSKNNVQGNNVAVARACWGRPSVHATNSPAQTPGVAREYSISRRPSSSPSELFLGCGFIQRRDIPRPGGHRVTVRAAWAAPPKKLMAKVRQQVPWRNKTLTKTFSLYF